MGRCYCHLTEKERFQIEAWLKTKTPVKVIAEKLNKGIATIYREIRNNQVDQLTTNLETIRVYSAELSWNRYQKRLKDKGPLIKLGNDMELHNYIEEQIMKHHYSPYAVLKKIKKEDKKFKTEICLSTLYNYIRKKIFYHLRLSDLPEPNKKKKNNKVVVVEDSPTLKGTSIDERPDIINDIVELNHWEMDCVLGTKEKGKCLLVLTERMSLKNLVLLMPEHTNNCVVAALDMLERKMGSKKFRETFKSITVDNGCEFKNTEAIEKSKRNKNKLRTKVYVCHPYQAGERGRNENNNKFIRRFIPKGTSMKNVTKKLTKEIEDFMNNYPRPKFGGMTSNEYYNSCLVAA